jgi:hypothetical protein
MVTLLGPFDDVDVGGSLSCRQSESVAGAPKPVTRGARTRPPEENWLDVGVGICSGRSPSEPGGGDLEDFTALGES